MSNLAVLLSLCASTARADAPGNIYVSALQKSGGTAFGASRPGAPPVDVQLARGMVHSWMKI